MDLEMILGPPGLVLGSRLVEVIGQGGRQRANQHTETQKVKSGFAMHSACDRRRFASGLVASRTTHGGFREKGRTEPAVSPAVHSLQSRLASKNREKWAEFAHLVESKGRNSLQLRLSGGGRGIRTPGTVSRTVVFKTTRFNRSRIPPTY